MAIIGCGYAWRDARGPTLRDDDHPRQYHAQKKIAEGGSDQGRPIHPSWLAHEPIFMVFYITLA